MGVYEYVGKYMYVTKADPQISIIPNPIPLKSYENQSYLNSDY